MASIEGTKALLLNGPARSGGRAVSLAAFCTALFLVQTAAVAGHYLTSAGPLQNAGWLIPGLIVFMLLATLVNLSRELPWQSVLLGSVLLVAGAVPALIVGAAAGLRTRPMVLPWLPFLFLTLVLNARGTARLILRDRRRTPAYGFETLGLSVALFLVMSVAAAPLFIESNSSWVAAPKGPWVALWAAAAVCALGVATPAFISKKPAASRIDCHPLLVWVSLSLLCSLAAATRQFWLAACVDFGQVLLGAILGVQLRNERPRLRRWSE
jgi:hypothetical protein